MLLLLHALIPCLAAYMLPSSPVLLHICCPHPLSGCICTALVSLLFGTVISTSCLFHWFFVAYSLANTMLFAFRRAPPILLLVVMWYARV